MRRKTIAVAAALMMVWAVALPGQEGFVAGAETAGGEEGQPQMTLQGEPGSQEQPQENGAQQGTGDQGQAVRPVQTMPAAFPEIFRVTRTTITVRKAAGEQYSIDGGVTVVEPVAEEQFVLFTDLQPGTVYTVLNRTSGTAEADPSAWTQGTVVTTAQAPASDVEKRTKQGAALNLSVVKATRGSTFLLKLTGISTSGKITLSKADKAALQVKKKGRNKWRIALKAPGKVTLTVKAKGKQYRCKVTVLPYKIGKKDNRFFAHRGIANSFPENSRIALKMGMKAGFCGTNFDLWPSKPDSKGNYEFIVSHDNKLKDMTASKGLITRTLASKILKMKVTKGNRARKYKQKMMRMEDAIAITDQYNGCGQIEMKNDPGKPWSRSQTDELAKRLNKLAHPERYEVESMDAFSLRNFRDSKKKYPRLDNMKLNLVCGELTGNTVKYAQVCQKLGFDNMPTYYKKITKAVVKDCRSKGIGIAGYAHINEDSNLVAKELEPLDLDYIVLPSAPWKAEGDVK